MHWLLTIDTGLFHFINGSLSNPFFDKIMPVLSGAGSAMHWFITCAILAFAAALIFGNARARICALLVLLSIAIGDGLVVNTIKHDVHRPRPGIALPDAIKRLGSTTSGSMPSAHAANWFAGTMIAFIFYRKKLWLILPVAFLAAAVSFSRVYNGVHYPSDVLAGAIIGAGTAAAVAMGLEIAWQYCGRLWFPLWHARMPSLLVPEARMAEPPETLETEDSHWLRLCCLLIGLTLVGRLIYVAGGSIELSGDEAYHWTWTKHLAASYYSKPPGIALVQLAGTTLFGDTAFGVRFFSPVFAAMLSWLLLRFLARETSGRAAFWFLLVINAVPLLTVGSILMTVDSPLVLCWTWALIAGWQAVQPDGQTRDWLETGLAMGLAFLCKYSAFYQIICFGIFFALWAPARGQLRKPGPWLALLIFFICTLPVIIWNAEHQWITIQHVKGNAGLDSQWELTQRILKSFGDFWGMALGLLNPVFFIGAMWATFAFWKTRREQPLMLYLFCMSAPVFFGHAIYSLRSHILPNWIAPALPGMFLLMAIYWNERLRAGSRLVKPLLAAGLAIGFLTAAVLYDSNVIGKIAGQSLPGVIDPARRLLGWKSAAQLAEAQRVKLAAEGKPAFIIAGDYNLAGLFTFYSPPARKAMALPLPLVYYPVSATPTSQFYFWPQYNYQETRKGENAIYVLDVGPGKPEKGWFWKWLRHEKVTIVPPSEPAPSRLPILDQFESVQDLGQQEILVRGQVFHRVHVWACYGLK